jgi:undecaprenyl diphosphate synthase
MSLLERYIKSELKEMIDNDIRLTTIGNINALPEDVRKILLDAIEKTSANEGMVLNLALSYGGRDEIVDAVKKILRSVESGEIEIDEINEQTFSRFLHTSSIPDPDFLIRTSGEYRLSNFLLWQAAYTELYFTNILWPDFSRDDLIDAIADYQKRERRYGLTSDQLSRMAKSDG